MQKVSSIILTRLAAAAYARSEGHLRGIGQGLSPRTKSRYPRLLSAAFRSLITSNREMRQFFLGEVNTDGLGK